MHTILSAVVLGSHKTAILIPSDDESDDDLNDGQSDTSFPPLEELLAAAHNKAKSGSVVRTGKHVDPAPDGSNTPEPSATSGPGPDDEFSNQQQRRGSLGPSPEPLSGSPETLYATRTQPVPAGCAAFEPKQASDPDITSHNTNISETNAASLAEDRATRHGHGMQPDSRPSEEPCGTTSNQDGSICLVNDEWDRRFPFSHQAIRRRSQARPAARGAYNTAEPDQLQSILDPHCRPQSPRRAASSHGVELQQTSDSRCLFPRHNYRGDNDQTSNPEHRRPVPDDIEEQNEVCPAAPPQVEESRASTPTLPSDQGISEFELADTEPRLRLYSPCSADTSLGVETQQRSDGCCLSRHHDHRGDSVRTRDSEHRHSPVPDDGGEQDDESSVAPPLRAQESRASMPSLSGDQSGNDRELANSTPSIAGREDFLDGARSPFKSCLHGRQGSRR
ncbi:hypothetical protein C8A00DRAFT_37350 [Chaetomidium leptoderma]|uniref:Uncharacterized protein n=1 Tax=Chaetomidium leptoderma TaxID=669021 RepID=A0AAN6VEK7_9PEZI|nr:hypothetical protein C8A00DRAFT_37350 [Chaetomidium leptoderma]